MAQRVAFHFLFRNFQQCFFDLTEIVSVASENRAACRLRNCLQPCQGRRTESHPTFVTVFPSCLFGNLIADMQRSVYPIEIRPENNVCLIEVLADKLAGSDTSEPLQNENRQDRGKLGRL